MSVNATTYSGGIKIEDVHRLIDDPKIKPIHVSEAPEELYNTFLSMEEEMLEMKYTSPADTSNNKSYSTYAVVKVNGNIIAEIDNHGFTKSSNSVGNRISNLLPGSVDGQDGPILAQARAEIIAKIYGGEIEYASSALTQSEYLSIDQPKANIDYNAMIRDPLYDEIVKLKEARTLFLTQQIAQNDEIIDC